MTAVVVMTIGAAGILAMQGASVHANQDANETSTAVTFATNWMERVKRDARLWTRTGNTALEQTRYLRMVNTNAGTWFLPQSTASESAAADYFGFDTLDRNRARFCVNLRTTVVHAFNPLTGTNLLTTDANALRVDLRVWWHRATADAERKDLFCEPSTTGNAASVALPAAQRVRRHFLSTVVSWREPGWP